MVNPDYYAMWFALKIEYTFPMEFLSLSPCKNIAISVERTKLTQHQNRVRIESRMDISKVTDYLCVGSRVGNEHADELKILDFDLINPVIGGMSPDEIYALPPFRKLWIRARDTFFAPISIKRLLAGVEAALPSIQNESKVLAFCLQGKR
jgi:hypothetical protein